MRSNNRGSQRRHRFAEPTGDDEGSARPRDLPRFDPLHYADKEPRLRLVELWRALNVYERIAWVLAPVGAALIGWLVTRGVP